MKKCLLVIYCLWLSFSLKAQQVRILFDATKAEMAGNADWVIDADVHNIGTNSSGLMIAGNGDESNPQQLPTPVQANITTSTPETYWEGALSSWGIDLVKVGFTVETLPMGRQITYGNTTNPQDLTNYRVFIVDEPNIRFTALEKVALINFVSNGGGLFMISDHTVSDRNGDGYDSPAIWNDFLTSNTIQSDPFGISFDLQNFSQTSNVLLNDPADSILHGRAGTPTGLDYNNGTSLTLNRTDNPNVKGLIFKNGSSSTGVTNVVFARSEYGSGRICATGDSSPMDDGTGDPNDQLYSSYSSVINGSHRKLLINAVIWLANLQTISSVTDINKLSQFVYPNPSFDRLYFSEKDKPYDYYVFDLTGRKITEGVYDNDGIDISPLSPGCYILQLADRNGKTALLRFVKE